MAGPTYEYASETGTIEIKKTQKGYNVMFIPPDEAIPRGYDREKEFKLLIARMSLEKTVFTFFPFKGRGLYSMQSKYSVLEAIIVEVQSYNPNGFDVADAEDIFANLPDVFIENYNYGLGFLKKYNQIASFIETLGAKKLYVSRHNPTSYDKELKVITLNEKDLRTLRKTIDRIAARATKVAFLTKQDVIAELLLELIGQSSGHSVDLEKTDLKERITKTALRPLTEVSRERQK